MPHRLVISVLVCLLVLALWPANGSAAPPEAPLAWPVTGRITTRFSPAHPAIDLAAPLGTPVRAADAGRATWVGWRGGCGQTVLVDHDDGRVTWYCHLATYRVGRWQPVTRGDVLGTVGSTGYSTGPHLHFGIWAFGRWLDPLPRLRLEVG